MTSSTHHGMPRLAVVGLIWLIVVDLLPRVTVGPYTVSALFTLLTAMWCLAFLPLVGFRGGNSPHDGIQLESSGKAVPAVLLLFLALAWISLAFNSSSDGLQNVAVFTTFIAGAAVVSLQAAPDQVDKVLSFYRPAALLVTVVFLASTVAGVELYGPRSFALSCIVLVAIFVPYRGRHLLYAVAPLLVVMAAFLSLSRMASVICAALLVFLAVRIRQRSLRIPLAGIFAGLGALLIYWAIMFYEPFRDRFLGGDAAVSVGGQNFNTSGRTELWRVTVESAAKAPWWGQGPGTADAQVYAAFAPISHPHNEYLRLYHDFGLIGLTLFVVGFVLLTLRVWARARQTDQEIHWVALSGLLGVAVAALTDNVLVYPFVMAPLGVLVGCSLAQPLRPRRLEEDGVALGVGDQTPSSPKRASL
ncbi:O-antigen ligase family protein [Kocuria sp. M4R2S49]|uniref:O-antigen ligase family protein n=1 Tax=Kocuria rhizosphaericola TaxID=3376284 RepID=UPI0037B6700B